ncbi:6-phospho-beta-glucosidase, partial [Streptomyces sp. NPDC059233]
GQETTGAGGLAKALRTVPVVLDIAERVRRANPDAWIVDFTNPVGIVTRALLAAGHKAVGLCNVAIGFQRRFAALLDVAPADVHLDHVGLNHLTWERGVRLGGPDGEDLLPRLLAEHGESIAAQLHLPRTLLDRLGVVPSYYLRYFYAHDEVVREQGTTPSRAAEVAAMERELLALYADPALDEKPALLAKRGGAFYSEAAVDLAAALLGDGGSPIQVVNTLNNGTLPFLPDDAVIEVQARVGASGPVPLPVPRLDPLFSGLVAHVTAYEDLALDAALRGGRERVFKALLAHPLVGQYDLAEGLVDRLLAHNKEHLAWA